MFPENNKFSDLNENIGHNITITGQSFAIRQIERQIRRIAKTNLTVIVQGETGTGKELVARYIHTQSDRSDRPFVAVDCGALSESLIESEFFGHRRGAFTGAEARKAGYFEQASHGTLFLDEVGNLSLHAQMKLLRSIQERRIFPLGSERDMPINVRLVVATNIDLADEAKAGRFRSDLFYRLNEFQIHLPPLRARREDILLLAQEFLQEANRELHKHVKGFTEEAHIYLLTHTWPGNTRELRNAVRRGVLLTTDVIGKSHICQPTPARVGSPEVVPSLPVELAQEGRSLPDIINQVTVELEINIIRHVLRATKGNKSEAAKRLQIGYKTLQRKVQAYGLGPAQPKDGEQEHRRYRA